MFIYAHAFIHLHINILKPSRCLQYRSQLESSSTAKVDRQNFKIHFFSFPKNIFLLFICSFMEIYITPSEQHFKAFQISKFNYETSFLYQLFKRNSNFIALKPCKVIYLSIFYDFDYYLYLFICLFMHLYTFISTF